MYRNALEDDVRSRRDRGVLLGLVFSVVPIPPVALVGFVIDLLNLRLLARHALPERERHLVRFSLFASLVSLAAGAAVFAAVGWIVLHVLPLKLSAVSAWLQDLVNGNWPRANHFVPRRGVQDI